MGTLTTGKAITERGFPPHFGISDSAMTDTNVSVSLRSSLPNGTMPFRVFIHEMSLKHERILYGFFYEESTHVYWIVFMWTFF